MKWSNGDWIDFSVAKSLYRHDLFKLVTTVPKKNTSNIDGVLYNYPPNCSNKINSTTYSVTLELMKVPRNNLSELQARPWLANTGGGGVSMRSCQNTESLVVDLIVCTVSGECHGPCTIQTYFVDFVNM